MKTLVIAFILIFFVNCSQNKQNKIDSALLLSNRCSSCHNLDMPPKLDDHELAPPMMAVVFHLKDFIKVDNPALHKSKFVDFVSDYIISPSIKKSYCDKTTIKKYGLMPPIQLNTQEAQEVAKYIYNKYNPKEFYKIQQERIKFNSLPKAEQLAIKYGCFSCHQKEKPKLAPSFKTISQRSSIQTIKNSIINGSKGKYKNFKIAMPPVGKKLNSTQLDILAQWIKNLSAN